MKSRDQVLALLSSHRDELRRGHGVKSIALFGSVSRGDADDSSDIDVLVELEGPVTLFRIAALEEYLSDLLGVPRVDVVLRAAIFPALRESILREAIDVR